MDGDSHAASTRYLTAYVDERAVSLFFNELRSSSASGSKLFDDNMNLPGADPGTRITPLSPTAGEGAFMLIMSTHAEATALAQGLGYTGPEFATLADARSRFTLDTSRAAGSQ